MHEAYAATKIEMLANRTGSSFHVTVSILSGSAKACRPRFRVLFAIPKQAARVRSTILVKAITIIAAKLTMAV